MNRQYSCSITLMYNNYINHLIYLQFYAHVLQFFGNLSRHVN
jgi:hypothetical protein